MEIMEYTDRYIISDINNLQETLDKYGVAVIPNILDEKQVLNAQSQMWDMLETLTSKFNHPIERKSPDTWKSFYDLFPLHSMQLQHFVGHSQVAWDIRQNENVVNVFSKLWNTKPEDLLCSFTGASIHMPPELTKRGWFRNTWYHTDQSYLRNDLECYQAFVNMFDVNDHDATLTILEGSHKYHSEFAKFKEFDKVDKKSKEYKELKKDWYKLTEKEQEFYDQKNCKMTCVKCPKGSLVIWDSRTIHAGKEPDKTRKTPNIRFIVYVCMTPRKLCTSANLKKKQKAFNELRMTSHWPHKPKLFGKKPQTYGKEFKQPEKLQPPVLTDLGKRLAGF
jgi:ectoine hydroxylase-related dioxygenase (phytanoyl-CoA dioxygenase family)